MKAVRALAPLVVLLACGTQSSTPPPPKTASLGGDVVATVGSTPIERSLVEQVAAAQHLSARAALDLLIDDALAAEGAKAKGLDRQPATKLTLDRARARFVADGIQARALARGAPTDEEVATLTARHWQAFDAPAGVRVVHAVVMKKKGVPDEERRALAVTLEEAVRGATTEADFETRAHTVMTGKPDLRVEVLPPFTADGRMLEGNGSMDPTFVAAAFALDDSHPQSGIVATVFGWHVIHLLGRTPEKRVPLEERRTRLYDEVIFVRGKTEKDALLGPYRKGTSVVIDPAAEALMAGAFDGLRSRAPVGPVGSGGRP